MRTTSKADLAEHLVLTIVRTARRMRQESGTDLSPSLTAALSTVERHGPLIASELAARERIQRPTATRVLSRLEEQGLIERMPDPRDGRSSLVTATQAGRELLAELRTRKTAYLAARIETLTPDEHATLDRAADILERMLSEDRPDAGPPSRTAGPDAPRR